MQIISSGSQAIDEGIERFMQFLSAGYYSTEVMRWRRADCNDIAQFANNRKYKVYDEDVCRKFCEKLSNGRRHIDLTRREQTKYRTAQILLEYLNTGKFCVAVRWKIPLPITGILAKTIGDFMESPRGKLWAENTRRTNEGELRKFSDFINDLGIVSIADIQPKHIQNYIAACGVRGKETPARASVAIRAYLQYLFDSGILARDLSEAIPKINRNKQSKLPSLYSDDEIERLLNSIDRGNPQGKRDYAMIALSAHLGLRASDVAALKLGEIDWDNDSIRLVQKKTGKLAELPLLPLVGNAILEYLEYGRPKSELDNVFLQHYRGYGGLSAGAFGNIVSKRIAAAGLDTSGRRHGPHSLRHSLAARLLSENTPLPVISEALIHQKIETTEYYLRVDVENLRRCAVEIPATDFYTRNGGWDK
jgi:site-specific recombinase XerD